MKFRPEVAGLVTLGVAASSLLGGCATNYVRNSSPEKDDIPTICAPENALPLPSAANVATFVDERKGNIYPCLYLNDMGIPFNKPTNLNMVRQTTIHSEEMTITGNLGGLVIYALGGGISGNVEAHSNKNDTPMTIFNFDDNEGYGREVAVNPEKVRTKFCADECAPTVVIKVPNTPLWNKDTIASSNQADTTSIWIARGGTMDAAKERTDVVAGLALHGPSDTGSSKDHYTGGPDLPGQVISRLATSVDVTLPASAKKDRLTQTPDVTTASPTPSATNTIK